MLQKRVLTVLPNIIRLTEMQQKKNGWIVGMIFFDTHAHYDNKAFDEDRETLLAGLQENGVVRVINVGASMDSCTQTVELAKRYDYIYAAVGIHPNETGELNEERFASLKELCLTEKCVAVGEIGLDYYWDEPERDIQKNWFVRQLYLARECRLPVIIHSRDAAKDTLDIMTAEKAGEIGGVVHCYAYTKETAKIFLNMGFYFGIGGVLTFKNARKLKEAVEYIPLDRIVLETDCPYLAPVPYRGKRNSSLYLPFVLAALAEIKGVGEEQAAQAVWENSLKLYHMNAQDFVSR